MKTILKWLVGTLTTLVAIIVLIAITLPILLDPNRYRQEIADLVHQETGFYLNINGEIDWSVFPWVGLSINDVVVDDINKKKLASLRNVAVGVKLMPLLSKKIQVSDIKLDGVDLNLFVAQNGTPNWLPASKPAATRTAAPAVDISAEESAEEGTEIEAFSLQDLSVAGIAISDINVSYHDESNNQSVAIKNAQLHTGAFAFGQPFQLTASLDLENKNPAIQANIAFTTMMNSIPEEGTYTIDQLDLTATPIGVDDPAKIELKGNLEVKDKVIKGKLALAPVDLFTALSQLNVSLPRLTGGDTVLRNVSIGTDIEISDDSIALNNMFATIDKNELKGFFGVDDLKKTAIRFNLTGNDIVVDPYLPVADAAAAPASSTSSASAKAAPQQASADPVIIPVDVLKGLNVRGEATLESLTAKGFLFQKPTLAVHAEDGDVRLTKLDAGFYEGKISASAAVNVAGTLASNPQISATAGINGVSIPAMATQIPALEKITGTTNANVKVLTHGLRQSQIISGLNGTIDFQVADGALLGVNFNQLLCSMIARIRKEESTRTDWPEETAFTRLGGTAHIKNGVIYNNDLAAALATVNVKGDGHVNLVNESINYHIGLTVTGNAVDEQDNACRINKRYANITWPMQCKGQLGEPGLCGIDEARLLKVAADLLGSSIKDKLQKELNDKLGGKLGEQLQGFEGLFNNL